MPDFSTTRIALPSLTRALFGENVNFLPMISGKMADGPDPSRSPMLAIRVRFDADFDIEQVGGGREGGSYVKASSETATVSVERHRLPWVPKQGDRLQRMHPVTGTPENYRIQRDAGQHGNVLLFFLSPL